MLVKAPYVINDDRNNWFDLHKERLIDRGWQKLTIDTLLFTKSGIIIIVYRVGKRPVILILTVFNIAVSLV